MESIQIYVPEIRGHILKNKKNKMAAQKSKMAAVKNKMAA